MAKQSNPLFIGGELCLNFVDRANWQNSERPVRFFGSYSDLIDWAQSMGILTKKEADRLQRQSREHEQEAADVMEQAMSIQDAIYHIVSASIKGKAAPPRDLEILNTAFLRALPYQRVIFTKGAFQWAWITDEDRLDRVLWPILRSTADLLTSDHIDRVKKCGGCGWLFLDTSKNASRRWCTMSVCGNRDKARRYQQRKREKRPKRIQSG